MSIVIGTVIVAMVIVECGCSFLFVGQLRAMMDDREW